MGRKFRGRAGSPSNTKSPGLRPTSIPSGVLMHPAVWPHRNRPKIGEGAPLPLGRGAGFPANKVAWAEACLHAKYQGSTESLTQTASRSVQPFLQGSLV